MNEKPIEDFIVRIPTSKFLDKMNPYTGRIVSKHSYLEYIKSDEFISNLNAGNIGLYINNCSPYNEDGSVKDCMITSDFIAKYRLGIVYEANESEIAVCLCQHLDSEILEYIKKNAATSYAGIFGASKDHMEGLDVVDDVIFILGYQLYDEQYRPSVDLIFKLGETFEERCRRYKEYSESDKEKDNAIS